MSKIGILTFQGSINYGASLQCTALSYVISNLGHDVSIINYNPEYARRGWAVLQNPFYFASIKETTPERIKEILRISKSNIRFFQRLLKKRAFTKYWERYYRLTEPCNNSSDIKRIAKRFDVIVCGSDQIWNSECTGGKIDKAYFFADCPTKKVAYAPSFGSLKEKEYLIKCKSFLDSFSAISVREDSSRLQLDEIGVKNVRNVLDPTLLVTKKEWENLFPIHYKNPKHYILVYTLDYSQDLVEVLNKILYKSRYDVVDVSSNSSHLGCKYIKMRSASPDRFFSLIQDSDLVLTNSFHATVFSIILQKKFVSFSRKGMESRIFDLLKEIGLIEHLYNPQTKADGLDKDYRYNEVEKTISRLRELSLEYLESNL